MQKKRPTRIIRETRLDQYDFTITDGLFDGPTHVEGTGLRNIPLTTLNKTNGIRTGELNLIIGYTGGKTIFNNQ